MRKALGTQADAVLQQLHLAGLIVVSEAEYTQAMRKASAYDEQRARDAGRPAT